MLKFGSLSRGARLLDGFIKPLISLLDLVRARKVEILDVPTAPISQSVARYVEWQSSNDLFDIGEFAVAASSLTLLKSRELTPWLFIDEVDLLEDPSFRPSPLEGNSETIAKAAAFLSEQLVNGRESFTRGDYVDPYPREIIGLPLSPAVLGHALDGQIAAAAARGAARVPLPVFMRIELATRALQRSLRQLREVSFLGMLRERRIDRRSAVVYFLAVLDMARQGVADVRQGLPFDDIVLICRGTHFQ
jgi:chromatin segregation and condensation protein Rec8/ScpA/Scc1 (kleisin family)